MGVANGIHSLTRAIGPPIAGLLYDHAVHLPFLTGAVAMLAIGAFAVFVIPGVQRSVAVNEAC